MLKDLVIWITGQFADKPTRGQSGRGLVNSPTATVFLNHEKRHYISTPNLNLLISDNKSIDYWNCLIE